jgi:serine/threonine protein kinase
MCVISYAQTSYDCIILILQRASFLQVIRSYDSRFHRADRSPKVYLETTIVPGAKLLFVLQNTNHLELQDNVDCSDREWLWRPNGGGLMIISTPFYEGCHWAESPSEFVPIALHLDEMHAKEIVHADVRAYNINIRKDSTGRSCLIDFDFSGKIDEATGTPTYPEGCQQVLVDGLRKGKPGRQVTKWHDWAALLDVIFRVHGLEPPSRVDDDDLDILWRELKQCMKVDPGTVQGLGHKLVTFLNKVDGTWTFTRDSSFIEELDDWRLQSDHKPARENTENAFGFSKKNPY